MTEKQLIKIAKNIKLLILDVDGVLTDGSIILDSEDNELKVFYVRDGHGIKMAQKAGINIAIISGRYSKAVERRAKELGITEVYQRCHRKTVAYEHMLEKFALSSSQTAYIGDDIVDISLMKEVGLSIAVSDSHDSAKENAMMVTKSRGGRGAVREVIDFLLSSRGLWDKLIDEYSEI